MTVLEQAGIPLRSGRVQGAKAGRTPGMLQAPPPGPADGVRHGVFDVVIRQVTDEEDVTPESLAARA